MRGDQPSVLVIEADATDPVASGDRDLRRAGRDRHGVARELRGPDASHYAPNLDAVSTLVLQRRYNPEGITQYNIVPGLLGVILTMTMVMLTALA